MRQRLMILSILLLCAISVCAQDGLHINAVFGGRIVPKEDMVEVKVKGRAVSKYNLSYYHSVRFKASEKQLADVEFLLDKDKEMAVDKEEIRKKDKSTLIISLPPKASLNRYLCALYGKDGKAAAVTLVYMEGKAENIAELRKLIK